MTDKQAMSIFRCDEDDIEYIRTYLDMGQYDSFARIKMLTDTSCEIDVCHGFAPGMAGASYFTHHAVGFKRTLEWRDINKYGQPMRIIMHWEEINQDNPPKTYAEVRRCVLSMLSRQPCGKAFRFECRLYRETNGYAIDVTNIKWHANPKPADTPKEEN